MRRNERLAFVACVALATAYWLSLFGPDYPGHWLLKASPMLIAAVLLARGLGPRAGLAMAFGYLAAAGGDIFLAFDRHAFLLHALVCFLFTQIAYIVAFSAVGRDPIGRWRRWLPALLYGLVFYLLMLPSLGDFLLPVLVYVAVLVGMVIAAATVESRPGPLLVGALLFLVADSLIGFNRFIQPFAGSEPLIVLLYSTGQLLILYGALKALPRP